MVMPRLKKLFLVLLTGIVGCFLVFHLTRFSFKQAIDHVDVLAIERALATGADPNAEFRMAWIEYRTTTRPLSYSVSKGQFSIVSLLLNHSCNPNLTDYNGQTAFMNIFTSEIRAEIEKELFDLLIKVTDLTMRDNSGQNALHLAARFGEKSEYDAIFAADPSLGDVRDRIGNTPLMYLNRDENSLQRK